MSQDIPFKVFCLSMQRTGTTSTGVFFRDHGLRWAGWPADERFGWSQAWLDGDLERIFASPAFRQANAFEDSPWFMPGLYRVLHHRFPGARFVLFTRDPAAWFRSMLALGGGAVIGPARLHCAIYRREQEYLDLVRAGRLDEAHENRLDTVKTMRIEGLEAHYQAVYRLHNESVQDYFARHAPHALHVGRLEDPGKWQRLGAFLGLPVAPDYDVHEHRSEEA